MILNIVSVYLFITVLLSMFLASYVQTRSNVSYTRVLLFLCFAVCFYMYGYSMEINAKSVEQVIFWNKIQYIGIPFVSALWLTIALMYTGQFFPIKKLLIIAIFIIPTITFFARFTNGFHHLYFSEVDFDITENRILIIKKMGPIMYLQLIHSLTLVIAAFGILIRAFIKSTKADRMKVRLMLSGSIFAVAGILINISNPFHLNIDFMVIFLPFTCFMVIVAILRYDFLEIKTMARDMAFESSNDGMLLLNMDNRVIDYNEKAKEFFDLMDISLSELVLSDLIEEHKNVSEAFEQENQLVIRLDTEKGIRYYEVLTKRIGDEEGIRQGLFKTIRDVTKTHELNENLRLLAATDELSKLLNRREFIKQSKEMLQDKRYHETYLLMMDLDYFKGVNDKYGHLMGDEVIKGFGEQLKNSFRDTDIVARLGGEEFAVLMKQTTQESAYKKAEEFCHLVEMNKYKFEEETFNITVSIGIARATGELQTIDSLLNKADIALYKAKNKGRNQVYM